MKRNKLTIVLSVLLAGSLLFSSCVGSYGLVNRVSTWNKSVSSNKFVNALVSVAFWIIPVYEISLFVDGFILNSIEFWSGSNPLSADIGKVKKIKSDKGNYFVEVKADGYSITNDIAEGHADFKYDEDKGLWTLDVNDKEYKLLKINDDGTADLYMPDGTTKNFTLDESGLLDARLSCNSGALFAGLY